MTSCQQLQAPFTPKTDTSNVSWQGLIIQRDDLPKSTNIDDNVEVETVELEATTSNIIPELDLPTIVIAPQDLDPQIFLGQSPDQLKYRLGTPSILRKEGNVEIWQYQLPDCVVDFFFYDNSGMQAATHADMRSPFLGGQLDKAACRHALYKISQ